jgi:membrane protease YdiL (CAAX protease family)
VTLTGERLAERTARALVVSVALLTVFNVLNNRVLPSWSYVPVNLAEAVVLLAVARWAWCSWADLGLAWRQCGRGLLWGLGAMGVILAVYLIAVAIPLTRGYFEDDTAEHASFGRMVYEVLIRIPLGTVVLEEIAFRAVLLALAVRRWSWRWAATFSSVLFGLWHILPASELGSVNGGLADVTGGRLTLAVVAAVISTFVAGLVFCWLRRRCGSLVGPMLLHVATNSIGFFFAWILT